MKELHQLQSREQDGEWKSVSSAQTGCGDAAEEMPDAALNRETAGAPENASSDAAGQKMSGALHAGETISDRVMEFVERPEEPKRRISLHWLRAFLWPTVQDPKPKKPVRRMDAPGLSTQQRIWIGVQTILSSLLPLLLYLTLPGLMMCIGMAIRNWSGDAASFVNASGNFYYALGIVLCFFLLRWKIVRGGERFRDAVTLYLEAPNWRKAGSYAILGMAVSIFLSAMFTLLPFFASYKSVTESAFQRTDLALAMVSVFMTAPICEEVIFRGIMLNRLLAQFSERSAVFLTAAIFAACHGNLAWSCYAFVMGVLLGFVSIKEDNIFYSIVLHMAFNLWTVVQLLIRQSEGLERFLFGSRGLIAVYGLLTFLIMLAWCRVHPDFTEAAREWLKKKERT